LSAIKRVFNAIVRDMSYSTSYYFSCFGIVKGWHESGLNATELLREAQGGGRYSWSRFQDALMEIDNRERSKPKRAIRTPCADEDLFG
jgi:hypothetical protein